LRKALREALAGVLRRSRRSGAGLNLQKEFLGGQEPGLTSTRRFQEVRASQH
jgi:hypothetical protein